MAMFIPGMELIVFAATILCCLYIGHASDVRVWLRAEPSPVTEGQSFILSCALPSVSFTYASFYFENRSLIGTVRQHDNSCINGTTNQVCFQRCSCTKDGSGFSVNISHADRSWNKVQVHCHAGDPIKTSKSKEIIVTYGPEVDLVIVNTTENTTNFRLNCTAKGEPDIFTFSWKHMFGLTVIRTTFDNITSSGSVSTLTIPKVTYQDMGTYECNVVNGHRGGDDRGFLSVEGRPRVIAAKQRYVTEKDISLDINITFISFPEPLNTTILRLDSTQPPQSELSISVLSVPVTMPFYNNDVSVNGYITELHFSKFETKHQGRYQLYVWNAFAYYYDFDIAISDKPDPPTNLTIEGITDSSAMISWTPMEDNGHNQTFTVICRYSEGTQTNVTLNHSVSTYTVRDLDRSTVYQVTVYASNVKGISENVTNSFKTKSGDLPKQTGTTTIIGGAAGTTTIIGGAAGAAAVLILIVGFVAVLIRRRRRHPSAPEATDEESDDDNDGMKANVLYESAGPNYIQQPGPSTADQSGDVYAVVQKPRSRTNATETQGNASVNNPEGRVLDSTMYAQVQKPEKGKAEKDVEGVEPKPEVPESQSPLYSEVKKTTKGKADKEGFEVKGRRVPRGKKPPTDGQYYKEVLV